MNAFPTIWYAELSSESEFPPDVNTERAGFQIRTGDRVKMFPTVLYVDRNSEQRIRLAEELEKAGFFVRTAECAFEALDLAARYKFDVMILNYELPEMTGAQLAQQIRVSDPGAQILLLSRRWNLPARELVDVDFHAVMDLPPIVLIEIVETLLQSAIDGLDGDSRETSTQLASKIRPNGR
jgi:CheY-like chemotaxis protein